MRELIMYTDGSSKGNPGESSIGVVFKDPHGTVIDRFHERIPDGTAPSAEYEALLRGLQRARDVHKGTHITAFADNLGMVKHINHVAGYHARAPHLLSKYEQIRREIDGLDYFHLSHVYRNYNKEADTQANLAFINNKVQESIEAAHPY